MGAMRRVLLLVLVVLLPLRLWAADAMLLGNALAAPLAAHAACHGAPSAPLADARVALSAAGQPEVAAPHLWHAPAGAASAAEHAGCPLCGLCHQALGWVAAPLALAAAALPPAPRLLAAPWPDSALPPIFKPPRA